jgi:hypothetical protein
LVRGAEITSSFAILSEVLMRVLFAISVIAFAALVWASLSIAQHIRRASRRRKLAVDAENLAEQSSEALAAEEVPQPAAEVFVPAAVPPGVRFPLSSQRMGRALAREDAEPATDGLARPDGRRSSSSGATFPDWAYYNKEMGGDLSDPTPSGRYKVRSRQ